MKKKKLNEQLPLLRDVEDEIRNYEFDISKTCILFFNKGYQKAREDLIKEIEEMIESTKAFNVLSSSTAENRKAKDFKGELLNKLKSMKQ